MAPYPIFFRALKTIIMPNFMLLTESEQLKHISALLLVLTLEKSEMSAIFVFTTKTTQSCPQVLSVNGALTVQENCA